MKIFLEENWFKVVASIVLIAIGGSCVYYYFYFLPVQKQQELEFEKTKYAQELQNEVEKEKQAEIDKQQALEDAKEARFREECVANKKAQWAQVEKLLNSCLTQECIENMPKSLNDIGAIPDADYIENCIYRKQNGLPTFDY